MTIPVELENRGYYWKIKIGDGPATVLTRADAARLIGDRVLALAERKEKEVRCGTQ